MSEAFETSEETKPVNSNGVGVSLQSLSKKIKTDAGEIAGESIFALSEDVDRHRTFLGTIDINHINRMNLSYKECIKSLETLNSKLSDILKKREDLQIRKAQVLEEEARIQATKKQLE
ncbi:hypothetical protein RHMOL_Rhmol03G0114400 [Rhododendron molle]|uniref:Uncharacterized protein n=1 Tax=Rhododendron molle TaxID=49168 RepID=A0ACC0PD48_RHOML|nr:hypothetical protein RHMOL_Rhmol03G0114400 [Rhododendron molle]